MICSQCGKVNAEGALHCGFCGGWNLSGGPGLVDTRHPGAANVGFADGHCKPITDLRVLHGNPRDM